MSGVTGQSKVLSSSDLEDALSLGREVKNLLPGQVC